jgi:hypothetical protein
MPLHVREAVYTVTAVTISAPISFLFFIHFTTYQIVMGYLGIVYTEAAEFVALLRSISMGNFYMSERLLVILHDCIGWARA